MTENIGEASHVDSQSLENLDEESDEEYSDTRSGLLEKQRKIHVSAEKKEQIRVKLLERHREGGGVA